MNQKDIKQLAKDIEKLRGLFKNIIDSLEVILYQIEKAKLSPDL